MTHRTDTSYAVFLFGPFRLVPAQHLLLNGDVRVPLDSRTFEILIALVEHAGEPLTWQALMSRAWPETPVDEANLKVQMATLRRVLDEGEDGQRYIATIGEKGYQFVAPLERRALPIEETSAEHSVHVAHNIPAALARPIGRSATTRALTEQMARVRLLTVTGPGGIGKTTVALDVARAMVEAARHDVWFVDLSTLSNADVVPQAVANAVGLAAQHHITSALATYFRFRNRPQLVVLDNCDHVSKGAAATAQRLLAMSPRMQVLATNRKPLQNAGEHLYRLQPLDSAVKSANLTAQQALQYPAIKLFVERASATRKNFQLTDESAPVIADICQRVGGIALAIELVATHVGTCGVHDLQRLLDDRMRPLNSDRRGTRSHHRTMSVLLDWSHQLLTEVERIVLRRLGIFAGVFVLDAVVAIVADEEMQTAGVVEAMKTLVAKSMVSAEAVGAITRYRLLDTTRDYARRKLADADEAALLAHRHAAHFCGMYTQAEDQWNEPPDAAWLENHVRAIDDVRIALNWAFSAEGEAALAVRLTVSAIPAWLHLSSLEECRNRVEQALSRTDASSPAQDRDRMKLYEALAASTLYTCGMVPTVESAWKSALDIAEALGDKEYYLRALFVACCGLVYAGELPVIDEFLQKFRLVASSIGNAVAISDGDRLTAYTLHRIGKQVEARQCLERMLARDVAARQRSQLSHFHVDWRNAARTILTNVLWLQGFPEQALKTAQSAREDAQAIGHGLTLGYVLVLASVPLAFYLGDLHAAEEALEVLQAHLARRGLVIYDPMARCLQGALLIQRKDPSGLLIMSDALDQHRREHFIIRYPMYMGMFAQGLLSFDRHAEARAAIDEALVWSDAHDERWCMPELLRIKGDIVQAMDVRGEPEPSESYYRRAMEMAREQNALSWELRAATSLARCLAEARQMDRARALLASVYDRFTEGFDTPDLRAARVLLDSFGNTIEA
ncbi:winged helix-turn-helix domain-containing protein [Paraburkholderia sp. C35]|uniref:ATP-binding protein n=1 Tax=Paraburkholderia sp. C35 TaxID=2126993 RepID=UPI000D69046F|nr:winged helix-turn-helix domain-containing protein [Paraburkholderia sp. C35]